MGGAASKRQRAPPTVGDVHSVPDRRDGCTSLAAFLSRLSSGLVSSVRRRLRAGWHRFTGGEGSAGRTRTVELCCAEGATTFTES